MMNFYIIGLLHIGCYDEQIQLIHHLLLIQQHEMKSHQAQIMIK